MSGAIISGICTIIGGIISPIIAHKLNESSNVHNTSKNNVEINETAIHYINKRTIQKRNLNIKRFLKAIMYIVLFLLGIIIYIILFQLLPKTSENDLLNDEIISLNSEIDRLNGKLSSYETPVDPTYLVELKMQLSKDAIYSINILQKEEFNDQEHLLHLYRTFVQLLYELENKDNIDLNRLIENMEQAEKELQYYM